jgi:HAD superfamily hydrolase (TIGR01509 family)
MDGVIVDSTAIHTQAWRVYLNDHGLAVDDLESRMLGKHNDELVRDFFPTHTLTQTLISHHGSRKEAVYRGLMSPILQEKLVPGARQFILRHCDGTLGIATNAEPENVSFILDSAGLRSCFRAIVDGHQVARPKPFPDIYLEAAKQLGCSPGECVVFEDSVTGVRAARAAGMRVVGVTTTLSEFADVDLTVRDFLDPKLELWLQQLTLSH